MNRRYAEVAARAQHRCEYCRAPEAIFNLPFEVEHVLPPRAGGGHDVANLALACRSCNLFKSDRTEAVDLETGVSVSLYSPRRDRWNEHFRGLASGEIEGLTAIGRAAVNLLRMNAEAQVVARSCWMRLGLYP